MVVAIELGAAARVTQWIAAQARAERELRHRQHRSAHGIGALLGTHVRGPLFVEQRAQE